MFKKFPRIFKNVIVLVLMISITFVAIPQEAQARNLFKQFFRDLRRGVGFIVKLPDKATRWMGPVLGPIASTILTGNLSAHHKFGQLFNNARRVHNAINDIEEQKRLTGEVKKMYRDQSGELRKHADKLREAREKLKEQLVKGDVNLKDYMETAVNLDNMIETVDGAADRFEHSANNLRTDHIIKMAAGNLLEQVIGQVKNVALNEVGNELSSFITPEMIDILTGQGPKGLDALIALIASDDIEKYDGKFDMDEMLQRIKDRVREVLEQNKDGFKGNLKNEIQNIVNQVAADMESDKEGMAEQIEDVNKPSEPEVKKNPYNDDELVTSLTEIPKDVFGCKPGYEWQRMSGVGCVQKDCSKVGAHYSYTKACICGFMDPPPGAKTQPCTRPSNYLACPSCVFTCVGADEECPGR